MPQNKTIDRLGSSGGDKEQNYYEDSGLGGGRRFVVQETGAQIDFSRKGDYPLTLDPSLHGSAKDKKGHFIIVDGTVEDGKKSQYIIGDSCAVQISEGSAGPRCYTRQASLSPVTIGEDWNGIKVDSVKGWGYLNVNGVPVADKEGSYFRALELLKYAEDTIDKVSNNLAEKAISSSEKGVKNHEVFNPEDALVSIAVDDKNFHVVPLDKFNPEADSTKNYARGAVYNRLRVLEEDQKQYLKGRYGASTSSRTDRLKEEKIDVTGDIFNIIDQYLIYEPRGEKLKQELGIENRRDLFSLTPAQAVKLVGNLMHDLTNYNRTLLNKSKDSPKDRNPDVVTLLRNGLNRDSKESIPSMGVCRHYSEATVELFNALKSRNPDLKNTFCFPQAGFDAEVFGAMSAKDQMRGAGHAWNIFVTFDKDDNAISTAVDPTWAKRDDSTGELLSYDQSFRRMRLVLQDVCNKEAGSSIEKKKNVKSIIKAYQGMIHNGIEHYSKIDNNGRPKFDIRYDIPESDKLRLSQRAIEEVCLLDRIDPDYNIEELSLNTRDLIICNGLYTERSHSNSDFLATGVALIKIFELNEKNDPRRARYARSALSKLIGIQISEVNHQKSIEKTRSMLRKSTSTIMTKKANEFIKKLCRTLNPTSDTVLKLKATTLVQ